MILLLIIFIHLRCFFAVGLVLRIGAGVVVMAGKVGHEEIAVLDFRVTLGVQRRPDGRKAGVGDGAGSPVQL